MFRIIGCLSLILFLIPPVVPEEGPPEIRFSPVLSEKINFKALENYLETKGTTEFLAELGKRLSYIKISERVGCRYFGMAVVKKVDLNSVTFDYPSGVEVHTAEVHMRVVVYDT